MRQSEPTGPEFFKNGNGHFVNLSEGKTGVSRVPFHEMCMRGLGGGFEWCTIVGRQGETGLILFRSKEPALRRSTGFVVGGENTGGYGFIYFIFLFFVWHTIARRTPPLPLLHQAHLPLHLVPEIIIPLVKSVHSHVAVLPAARVSSPQRIHRHRVEWAEMPLNAPDLVLEDLVVEAGFEFALAGGGGGDVHGGLAAAEDDEGLLRGDGGGVEGGVGRVGF